MLGAIVLFHIIFSRLTTLFGAQVDNGVSRLRLSHRLSTPLKCILLFYSLQYRYRPNVFEFKFVKIYRMAILLLHVNIEPVLSCLSSTECHRGRVTSPTFSLLVPPTDVFGAPEFTRSSFRKQKGWNVLSEVVTYIDLQVTFSFSNITVVQDRSSQILDFSLQAH